MTLGIPFLLKFLSWVQNYPITNQKFIHNQVLLLDYVVPQNIDVPNITLHYIFYRG